MLRGQADASLQPPKRLGEVASFGRRSAAPERSERLGLQMAHGVRGRDAAVAPDECPFEVAHERQRPGEPPAAPRVRGGDHRDHPPGQIGVGTVHDEQKAVDGLVKLAAAEMSRSPEVPGQDAQLAILERRGDAERLFRVSSRLAEAGAEQRVVAQPMEDASQAPRVAELASERLGFPVDLGEAPRLPGEGQREVQLESEVDRPAEGLLVRRKPR